MGTSSQLLEPGFAHRLGHAGPATAGPLLQQAEGTVSLSGLIDPAALPDGDGHWPVGRTVSCQKGVG